MPRSSRRALPLLSAQLVFNLGFYAVVPFLALVLTEDFALAGAAVGVVLGIRTFAQQGMFLVGGVLADRLGARTLILSGCLVRVSGFASLALAVVMDPRSLPLFLVGTVLTGLGGALFSPALNVLVARAESARPMPSRRGAHRATLFAVLTVFGEVGAAIGPVIGAALLGLGFAVVAASGAVLFVVVGVALLLVLPRDTPAAPAGPAPSHRRWASLQDRRFRAFAALHAVDLLAYNQMYLAVPLVLGEIGAGGGELAWLFALASILTLTLQLPIARLSSRLGRRRALRGGYGLLALAFLSLAVGTTALTGSPWASAAVAAVAVSVALLVLGHMFTGPTALDAVRTFAGSEPTGSYYGLLATLGGVAVLLGNTAIGAALDATRAAGAPVALVWCAVAVLPVVTMVLAPRLVPEVASGRVDEGAPVGPRADRLRA